MQILNTPPIQTLLFKYFYIKYMNTAYHYSILSYLNSLNNSNTAPGVQGGGECQRESRDRRGDPPSRSACGPGWRGDKTSFIEYKCTMCVFCRGSTWAPRASWPWCRWARWSGRWSSSMSRPRPPSSPRGGCRDFWSLSKLSRWAMYFYCQALEQFESSTHVNIKV